MRLGIFTGLLLMVAIGFGVAVSPFASSDPDGLERVAQDQGFAGTGTLHPIQESAPVPDYAFPGVTNEKTATAVGGLAGTLGVFLTGVGLARVLRRRQAVPAG